MGFYPYMRGRLERLTIEGKRFTRAEVFDEQSNCWIVQDFDGYDPTEALKWIDKYMKKVEM